MAPRRKKGSPVTSSKPPRPALAPFEAALMAALDPESAYNTQQRAQMAPLIRYFQLLAAQHPPSMRRRGAPPRRARPKKFGTYQSLLAVLRPAFATLEQQDVKPSQKAVASLFFGQNKDPAGQIRRWHASFGKQWADVRADIRRSR
jgi:hypothetical protein